MTVRCLDCAKFSVQQATPSMQEMGYGACKDYIERNPEIGGNMAYLATAARECDGFAKADVSVIEKRERWRRAAKTNQGEMSDGS